MEEQLWDEGLCLPKKGGSQGDTREQTLPTWIQMEGQKGNGATLAPQGRAEVGGREQEHKINFKAFASCVCPTTVWLFSWHLGNWLQSQVNGVILHIAVGGPALSEKCQNITGGKPSKVKNIFDESRILIK